MAEQSALPRGTKPEGAINEQDASRKVREMFTRIAPRYDLLNHLLSAQMDRRWRARTAVELHPILQNPEALVLDLCCGTGDLAFSLGKGARAKIVGADFSHTMLMHAKEKSLRESRQDWRVPFFEADALRLPFADSSFDMVTTAFGFRNLANYQDGLREILRVLKPAGTLGILELVEPAPGLVGRAYRFYCWNILPTIGGWISGDAAAYRYLPRSVSRFFRPDELAGLMGQMGYEKVRYHLMTLGSVALHIGVKR